jgi:hypothetical protein
MNEETDKEQTRPWRATMPETAQKWLTERMVLIAMKHDLAGPDFQPMSETTYPQQLVRELQRCVRDAQVAGEIRMPLAETELLCGSMLQDVLALRRRKKRYQAGEISIEELRHWEGFDVYQAYFEDDPHLRLAAMLEDSLERRQERRTPGGTGNSSAPASNGAPAVPNPISLVNPSN